MTDHPPCSRCVRRLTEGDARYNLTELPRPGEFPFMGMRLCKECRDELLAAVENIPTDCKHDSCNGTGNPDEWECASCGGILRSESYVRDGIKLHRFVPVEPKPKVRATEIDDGMGWQDEHDPLSGNPIGEQDEILGRVT